MKVEITDDSVFNALSSKDLQSYLLSNDWVCVKRVDNTFSIWELDGTGQKHRIWLPEDNELGDFSQAMGRTIKTLATSEQRSQLDLLEDIDTLTIGDVVRVRVFDPMNTRSSSLPFEYGLSVIQRAKNLVIAGACATLEKKALFPARKEAQVTEYGKKLRLGQTERGSFITKIISPIAIKQKEIFDIVPFERQAVVTMLEGLDALHYIATGITKSGTFHPEAFEEAISQGVSALLCEAVTGDEYENCFQQTEIDVSWFCNELINKPTINRTHLSFSKEMMPFIKKAAENFHEKEPEELFVEGYVIALDRAESKSDGLITVLHTDNCGNKRKIKVKLHASDYKNATDAHRDGLQIECKGNVIKNGRSSVIYNPENFNIIAE
ncbi:MAG: hypothetical protein PHN45_01010 [Methylococcales bacterium]|nr:hypothetical protein [Methylococcales bacterium]MDD5753319.1 hypothetical protein [Methylococcales bacterium]